MSRKILFYLLVAASLLISPVHAATYADGEAAYEASDYKKAVSIWEDLAEQGDVTSQLKMATMYSAGFSNKETKFRLKKDRAAAFKLYNQAAEQGSAEAMFELGMIYGSGQENVKRDMDKAREMYLKAANQGHAKAQYYYGVTYFRGEGVPTDYVQGHAWMNVALENGYKAAKSYIETLEEILSEADLEESKDISDKLLAEMK
jgi:TPR repeat protein